MALPDLVPLIDEGLGNSAYLLDLGDGRALAVDPSRDLRATYDKAEARHLRIAYGRRPTCTPTSSPAHGNSPPITTPRSWPPPQASESSPTSAWTTPTR
jgi:hypothetical protein